MTGIPFSLGFARSVAIRERVAGLSRQLVGQQGRWLCDGGAIRAAIRAAQVEGLGLFVQTARTITLTALRSTPPRICHMAWSQFTVQVAA